MIDSNKKDATLSGSKTELMSSMLGRSTVMLIAFSVLGVIFKPIIYPILDLIPFPVFYFGFIGFIVILVILAFTRFKHPDTFYTRISKSLAGESLITIGVIVSILIFLFADIIGVSLKVFFGPAFGI